MESFEQSTHVTMSDGYKVTLPKEVRDDMKLKPGDTVNFIFIDGVWNFVKIPSLEELCGFAKGMDANFVREDDDRY